MCTGAHPFIPVANTCRLTAVFNSQGEVTENVYYVLKDAAWTPGDLAGIAGIFRSWWHDHGRHYTTSATELTEIKLVDLTVLDGQAYDVGVSGEGGDGAGTQEPNQVAVVIKWGTGRAGQSYHGRSFIVGVPVDAVAQNRLTSIAVGAYAGAYNALLTAITSGPFHLAIASFCNAKAWRTVGVATPIVSLTAEQILRTQRRRQPRG